MAGVEVTLYGDLYTVRLGGRGVNLLQFIVWQRAYIPNEYHLFCLMLAR
jgi:hypothetical protein